MEDENGFDTNYFVLYVYKLHLHYGPSIELNTSRTDLCPNFFLLFYLRLLLLCLQQAALVLNASRRFRYTLDLKKEEEREQMRRKIRANVQVIRVNPQISFIVLK